MPKFKINKRNVDAVAQGASDIFYWDKELTGFGLKVTKNGSKSYVVQYRMGGRGAPVRRYTIGKHGAPWTPDLARKRAQELLIAVKSGIDPSEREQIERRKANELAFDRYAQEFVERYAKSNQPKSWSQAESVLRVNAIPTFKSKPLNKITRRDVSALLESVSETRPPTARYLHATLRKLFRWAVGRGDLEISPMSNMEAPAPPVSRDRVLDDCELRALWLASKELTFPFGPLTRLLIATGQRRSEVSAICWSQLDLEGGNWTIPADLAKNGVAHIVPLNHLAIRELLELRSLQINDMIFSRTGSTPPSGWSKAKRRLDHRLSNLVDEPVSHWRLHDIRRTFATGMQRLGVRHEVTEALLNHVSGAKSGIVGVYQRYDWAPEKQAALEAWSNALDHLMSDEDHSLVPTSHDTVVEFGSRKRVGH